MGLPIASIPGPKLGVCLLSGTSSLRCHPAMPPHSYVLRVVLILHATGQLHTEGSTTGHHTTTHESTTEQPDTNDTQESSSGVCKNVALQCFNVPITLCDVTIITSINVTIPNTVDKQLTPQADVQCNVSPYRHVSQQCDDSGGAESIVFGCLLGIHLVIDVVCLVLWFWRRKRATKRQSGTVAFVNQPDACGVTMNLHSTSSNRDQQTSSDKPKSGATSPVQRRSEHEYSYVTVDSTTFRSSTAAVIETSIYNEPDDFIPTARARVSTAPARNESDVYSIPNKRPKGSGRVNSPANNEYSLAKIPVSVARNPDCELINGKEYFILEEVEAFKEEDVSAAKGGLPTTGRSTATTEDTQGSMPINGEPTAKTEDVQGSMPMNIKSTATTEDTQGSMPMNGKSTATTEDAQGSMPMNGEPAATSQDAQGSLPIKGESTTTTEEAKGVYFILEEGAAEMDSPTTGRRQAMGTQNASSEDIGEYCRLDSTGMKPPIPEKPAYTALAEHRKNSAPKGRRANQHQPMQFVNKQFT
ncbi:hypothetical protein BaRGS_00033851 [Batillaria attramentaria]|uniref:Uncharacterized protein n=1 Tax=Batillaria attramentaria TaxID=370345 RepID=A0ABD0JIZ1_9CAEN